MSTATDEKVEVDVDLDAPIPCYYKTCPTEAAWRIVNKPCSHSWTACEEHQQGNAKYILHVREGSVTATCLGCQADVTDMVMVPL